MTRTEASMAGKPEAMRVWLLDGFMVSVGSRTIEQDEWRLRKAASLVKLLALAPGHRLHREQAMDLLWPDLGRASASNNLRQALHAARQILAPDPSAGSRYLRSEADSLVLCPQGDLWVDVEAFEAAALSAQRSRESGAYEAAIELYAGELLPEDRYDEWAEERRRMLSETYTSLFLGLAWAYEERENHGSAIEVLRKVTREEPTNEEAHTGLMRLYALSGRRSDALRQYESLEEAIYRQVGTGPSASTRALREEIASGRFPPEVTRPLAPPPKEVSEPPKNNLPVPRTSFVGRGRELTEVKRALAMTRLLTLTGTGGSGKTRLALKVATDLAAVYPEGVWLVELASLAEPELVPQAVAEALGEWEQPGQPLVETIANYLSGKKVLLVLDNCEHLVDAAARLADLLLGCCPHLDVLATSRELLGVEGEVLFSVPSLSVPAGLPTDPGEIEGYDSVRLFVERTRMRLPGFSLTQDNAAAAAEVCKKLEGIPLAIELAAAWMETLATEQVAQRLEDSLGMLSSGPRTSSPRQRTMRAAIEWSHGLLSAREKEMFGRLSVFSGGFTLEAAEAVCPGGAIEENRVLHLLSGLVNKSLVVAEATGEGRVRYRILEPVRQYAQENLEERGKAAEFHRRHAAFFLALAERAEPELKGPGQVAWLKRLEEENDNLRAAIAWLLQEGEIERAVRLAWDLNVFWWLHGHQSEGRRWTEETLAKGGNLLAGTRARALVVQGTMSYGLIGPEHMRRLFEESAVLFRRAGDKHGLAYALGGAGVATLQQGDVEQATAFLERSLELFSQAGDKWGMSTVLAHLGAIPLAQGNHELAARYYEEALALTREIGNMLSGYVSLYSLAVAMQGQGDHERAALLYRDGLKLAVEAGDQANIAYCLDGLAASAEASGEPERAARLFGAAEALLEDAGGALYVQAQERSLREHAVDALRSQLDENTLVVVWAAGRVMTSETAVEYALSQEGASTPSSSTLQQSKFAAPRAAITRREEEIALLVARGLTNRQIATELSISEHTVANHIAKILRKRGLGSRSQITAWVVEQRTLS